MSSAFDAEVAFEAARRVTLALESIVAHASTTAALTARLSLTATLDSGVSAAVTTGGDTAAVVQTRPAGIVALEAVVAIGILAEALTATGLTFAATVVVTTVAGSVARPYRAAIARSRLVGNALPRRARTTTFGFTREAIVARVLGAAAFTFATARFTDTRGFGRRRYQATGIEAWQSNATVGRKQACIIENADDVTQAKPTAVRTKVWLLWASAYAHETAVARGLFTARFTCATTTRRWVARVGVACVAAATTTVVAWFLTAAGIVGAVVLRRLTRLFTSRLCSRRITGRGYRSVTG